MLCPAVFKEDLLGIGVRDGVQVESVGDSSCPRQLWVRETGDVVAVVQDAGRAVVVVV